MTQDNSITSVEAETESLADALRDRMYSALRLSESDFEDRLVVGTQGSAVITASSAFMTVRGGGIGASGWLARITGPDPKWGVQRDFVNADRHLSGSGRSGSIHREYECDGIYEYRNWAESSQRSTSGFFAVKHGEVADLGNRKVGVNKAAQLMADGARV